MLVSHSSTVAVGRLRFLRLQALLHGLCGCFDRAPARRLPTRTMAPAHAKITNKGGHGVHLSSPLSSNLDSDGGAMLALEMESRMKRTIEDGYSQKMDYCLSESSMEVPLLPRMPAARYKAVFVPSPASILGLISIHKSLKDAPRVASGLPGAPDTYLLPLPEHRRLEASMQLGDSDVPGCGPDVRDVPQAPAHLAPLVHGEEKDHPGLPQPVTVIQGEKEEEEEEEEDKDELVDSHHTPALAQPLGAGWDSARRPVSEAGPEEEVMVRELTRWHLSRQAGLQSWAARLQRRLQALQGRHAVLHCSQQLEGLQKALRQTRGIPSSFSNTQDDTKPHSLHPTTSRCPAGCGTRLPPLELEKLAFSNQAVLRGLQEALDSDATASSSSDEELDLDSRSPGGSKPNSRRRSHSHSVTVVPGSSEKRWQEHQAEVGSSERWWQEDRAEVGSSEKRWQEHHVEVGSSERRWQEDRAEVGSRWSWLQLRVAELQGRMQQLEELHKHICSTKGGVVLAKSQPLTDRQIQQMLLRETAGLSYTTRAGELPSDTDSEPSSPTRLLNNIQRQSAQLSQIVTSLSASSSPSSKQPHVWKGLSKRGFSSSLGGYELFTLAGSKRRKVVGRSRQQLLKADASRVCARTRPLVTYHKPKLFTLHLHGTRGSSQWVDSSPSSSLTSTCPSWSSCDPVALCSDPTCTSTTSFSPSRAHPVLSLSSDIPLSHHLQTALAREEWLQRPLTIKAERCSPGHYNTAGCDSTLLHNNQSHRHHLSHGRVGVGCRDPSPPWAGSAQAPNSRANQRRRRRRRKGQTVTEDEEDFLSQLSDTEDSSEDTWSTQTSHIRKQSTPGPVRRRQGDDSMYDIHNLAFPMALVSMAKVEKMEYKNILTRGWRVVECLSPGGKPEEEAVTDEAFHQRHLASEQREKQGWSALSMSPSYKQPSRSGSRWSAGVEEGVMVSSWSEDGTVDLQMDTEERTTAEEWLPPLSPWELRVFPLAEDEEKALFAEEEAVAPPCCSALRSGTPPPPGSPMPGSSTTVLASKSQLSSLALSSSTGIPTTTSSTTPPSGGQRRNRAPSGRKPCRSSPG